MSRSQILLMAVVLSALVLLGMITRARLAAARQDFADEAARLRSAQEQLERIAALEARIGAQPASAATETQPLLSLVQEALRAAGLSAANLQGVQLRQEEELTESGLQRRTQVIALRDLAPSQIGAWLDAWRQAEHPWQITDMEWRHSQGRGRGAGDDNRYDCSITCRASVME